MFPTVTKMQHKLGREGANDGPKDKDKSAHFESGGGVSGFEIFGLPFDAAPPCRAISDRRSGLNVLARAIAAFRAFSERRSGKRGFGFLRAAAISLRLERSAALAASAATRTSRVASRISARTIFPVSSAALADRNPCSEKYRPSGLL